MHVKRAYVLYTSKISWDEGWDVANNTKDASISKLTTTQNKTRHLLNILYD